jgi:hypothetical protein
LQRTQSPCIAALVKIYKEKKNQNPMPGNNNPAKLSDYNAYRMVQRVT